MSIAFLALQVGCGGETQSPTSEPPTVSGGAVALWEIFPQPGDLSTDIADTPIAVIVRNAGSSGQPSDGAIEAVRMRLSLRNASGEVVPSEAVVRRPEVLEPTGAADAVPAPESDLDRYVHIELRPQLPWGSGWYAIRLAGLPERTRALEFHRRLDGDYESRFTATSSPVFREVSICDLPEKGTYVTVTSSQPIAIVPKDAPKVLDVLSDGSRCGPSDHDADLMATELQVQCPPGAKSLRLALVGPLEATSGNMVQTLEGRDSFSLEWPADGWIGGVRPNCWVWQF